MIKRNQEIITFADELLRQFAQTAEDDLSAILTAQDLSDFEEKITKRKRKYPATKTLSLFMKQIASETKSCRSALIDDARDQIALGKKKMKRQPALTVRLGKDCWRKPSNHSSILQVTILIMALIKHTHGITGV